MAKNPERRLLETYRNARRADDHPHLDPINAATFEADRNVALAKAASLLGYQNYLVAARATKASRRNVSMAFERNVVAQARQARADLDALSGAVLRIAQQVEHTNHWNQVLGRTADALRETGPVDVKAAWAEIVADEQLTSALAGHGLSMDLTVAATEAISKVDAMLVMRDGKVSVEARVPGEAAPRRLSLRSTPTRPANIGDLLRRSQFDRVVSAITSNELVYIDALPGGGIGEYAPADLVAIGAVAARQRVAEHVRKLEDTGLATYEGEDPVTFFATLLVIALYLTLLSAVIIHLCENPGQVEQPDWVCTAGAVLAAISLGLLALVVLGMFIEEWPSA